MSKRTDEYNKKNYLPVVFRLKPKERERLDKHLKKIDLSRRKFILKVLDKEDY